MSTQQDWISPPEKSATRPAREVRDTRPTVAQQKAERLLALGVRLRTVPQSVRDGSINTVRQWRDARDKAAKVAASSRSSLPEIESAISSLARWG